MTVRSWLDSTGTLVVRIPRPGVYQVNPDGTVTRAECICEVPGYIPNVPCKYPHTAPIVEVPA